MCLNPARVATVVATALALAAASPAHAALFGRGSKAKAEAQAAKPAAPAAAATAPAPPPPKPATAEQRAAAERLDALARAAFWSREVAIVPAEAEAGVRLAAALRGLGRFDEAAQSAQQVLVAHPNNVDALLEDAKAKIEGGKPFYAIEPLKQAQRLAPKDWRPASLLGIAYEQTEQPDQALAAFNQALALSPGNPGVLSNVALFRAARGQTAEAETLLRKAVASPQSTARERQNLALVLGLQGKLAEAERLLRQDLPPEIAGANLAYLRNVAAQSTPAAATRNWGAMQGR